MLMKLTDPSIATALTVLGAAYCPIQPTDTNPDDGNPPTVITDCGSTKTSLKKSLMNTGYTEDAALGILGNLMQ